MSAEPSERSKHPECPTARQLQDWLDGEDSPEALVNHLADCQRCQHILASLTEDEDLRALAKAKPAGSTSGYLNEPEYAALRSRLLSCPQEDTTKVEEANSLHSTSTQRGDAPNDLHPEYLEHKPHARDTISIEALKRRLPTDRYLVDRLIASGGVGAVYLAFDQRLKREVAIKVLFNNSLKDRQRFHREARLLAEFEHANIVKVFDFGTLSNEGESTTDAFQSGQCYLVMEYVSGGTANRLGLDQPEWSSGDLDFARLAQLLSTAADGLAAAHARNLVHRDVKPGNLLLTADRSAFKVADFGLARLVEVDSTQFTRTGDLLGTPVFMSPEQVAAHGTVTHSSDIYSLGATLYQLITGVAPYQGGPAAVLRQIAESSPVAPRLIAPTIPADLETICLHAMQSEPTARYATMEQFAADLRSFAQGESILAKPVSTLTKAIRFLRRNKSFAAAMATAVALALMLTAGSVAAAIVFRSQNAKLRESAKQEIDAKLAAEKALKASITAADELLLAVTTETEFLPRATGSQEVTRKLLERARDYFLEFVDANQGNATLTYQLARAHAGLAEVAVRVGDAKSLERETEAALELIDRIPAQELSRLKRAAMRCNTMLVLANYLTESGEAKRSWPMLEAATKICQAAQQASLEEASQSDQQDLQESYALSLFGLANSLTWLGKREDALPHLKSAREMFEELRKREPSNSAYLRNAASCDVTRGTIALDLNQAAEGKQHLSHALELLEQVAEDDVTSLRIRELKVKVLTNLALAERRMGNNIEAKACYEGVIAETRRLIELEPAVASHGWNLVVAALNSGGPELELGNLESLVERWRATVPVLDKLIADDSGNQRYQQVKAMLQSNIAIVLRDLGKLDEAIAPLQAATETLLKQAAKLDYASESYLPVALNHYELAATYSQLKRYEDALHSLDESDAIVAQILEKDQGFTPARGHLLDSLHARYVALKRLTVDAEKLRPLVERELQLARELASSNTDVAEYQLELPRALNDSAELHILLEDFETAFAKVREVQSLLDGMEAGIGSDKQQPLPPEFRTCRRTAYLLEALTLVKSVNSPLDNSQRSEFDRLVAGAREFGASAEDLKDLSDAAPR